MAFSNLVYNIKFMVAQYNSQAILVGKFSQRIIQVKNCYIKYNFIFLLSSILLQQFYLEEFNFLLSFNYYSIQ